MELRNLIGIEIMEQGKLLKVTDAMFKEDNIVLITEIAEKDIKKNEKKEVI
jgi:large conductance mechanosensitive channel protein